jgi:hypothetical protein
MESLWNEIWAALQPALFDMWEQVKPLLIQYFWYLVSVGALAVLQSAWLAKQWWVVRMVFKHALEPVSRNNYEWDTQRIKEENGGKMPAATGKELFRETKRDVDAQLADSMLAKWITTKELKKGIEKAVTHENKNRRNAKKPGTKGGF